MSWKQAKLSDIADVQVGFAFPSKDFLDADKAGIFLLRGDNLQQGYIRWGEKTKKWTAIEDKKLERYFLQKHDVVLAMDRPIVSGGLKISKILDQDLPSYLVQRVMRLRGFCDIDTSYIFHLLRSNNFIGYIERITTGANIPHISHKEVVEYTFQLPPISIRKKIASILSNYDDLIQTNQQRIALLEEAAQRLYDEWFVKLRFPNHEQVPVVDGVPEGWVLGTVGDFYETSSGGTPSRNNKDYYNGEIFWVRTQELNGNFIFNTSEKITQDALKNSSAKIFPENTVLVAMYGVTIGELAILGVSASTNQACCAILEKHECSSYIHAYLFFIFNKQGLLNIAQGSAQTNVSQQVIKAFPMIMPPLHLMTNFVNFCKPIFQLKKNLELQNQKLAQARDALLPCLMSGKMDVSCLSLKEIA